MHACPDENALAAFMQGRGTSADRSAIESHVDRCPACAHVLAAAARAVDPSASTVRAVAAVPDAGAPATARLPFAHRAADDLAPGERVGRYVVIARLGRGGMGIVYQAGDPALERTVALKVMRADVGVAPEQLVREARALARLSHPNVVAVHDVGEDAGRVFVAMELVRGQTLRAWTASAQRTWEQVFGVFLQAARGLEAAHAAGMLHRDFKPENVFVGDDGRVRVGDFGLARILDDRPRTHPGTVVGTPAYMPPEQLRGEPLGPACDEFAFCVSLYEALWGARPFGDANLALLRPELTHAAPPPAGTPVPAWLFDAVARGLALDPARRHGSIGALADRLERGMSPRPDPHVRANAVLQIVMCALHAVLTAFWIWVLASPASTEPDRIASGPHDAVWGLSMAITVLVVVLLFFGWLPIGTVWTAINAWGLWRARRWALWSTIVYAIVSIPTCVGTPYAVYALFSLWGRARRKEEPRTP